MNTKHHVPQRWLALLLVAALALNPVSLVLADKDDHVEARELLERGEILPLAQILTVVQQHVPGDVIEVELERDDGVWKYEVKVLTQSGRVRKLYLDARNATVLKIKDD
jgi:uncharacterized membrane protein YkoI